MNGISNSQSRTTEILTVVFLSLTLLVSSAAEPKKKTPSPGPTQQNASVRVWSGSIESKRAFRVGVRSAGKKAPDLADRVESYRFADYEPIAAGALTIDVFDSKDNKAPLATVSGFL